MRNEGVFLGDTEMVYFSSLGMTDETLQLARRIFSFNVEMFFNALNQLKGRLPEYWTIFFGGARSDHDLIFKKNF